MIVNSHRPGRLGNQLLLHAHLMAYCIEHNLQFVNLAFREYNSLFVGTSDQAIPAIPALKGGRKKVLGFPWTKKILSRLSRHLYFLKFLPLEYHFINAPRKVLLSSFDHIIGKGKLAVMNGWLFHSSDLHVKYRSKIKSYFKPIPKIQAACESLVQTLRDTSELCIGCHIRRGDYANFMNGEYFFSHAEYEKVCVQLEQQFQGKKVKFYFCSDEPIPAYFKERFDCLFGDESPLVDMYTLAECDYIIGPPSTFSSWASYYGQVPRYELKNTSRLISLADFQIFK